MTSPLPAGLVGRKAAALGRLIEAGFLVPACVCSTTEAYNAAISRSPALLSLSDGLLNEPIGVLPMQLPLTVRSSSVRDA